jgi:hypothetical protein
MRAPPAEAVLAFDALALERCFLASDILHDDYGEPRSEYALLGLASEEDPFRVIATLLLPGQRVTPSTVDQSGHGVLQLRREIQALSERMRRRLVPISFVHRHPGDCEASVVDREFLCGVFIDQVSTAISWRESAPIEAERPPCGCPEMQRLWREALCTRGAGRLLSFECALCFSLIVNRERDHRLYAARCETCPLCRRREVCEVPARLAIDAGVSLSERQRRMLRARLAGEIAAKVVFEPRPGELELVR